MLKFVRWLGCAALACILLTGPVAAAGDQTTVKVALLDMTAMFGQGFGGYGPGMMGQGYGPGYGRGFGMMGPGYGMMGPGYGMMGPGYGMMGGGMMSIRVDKSSVRAGVVRFDVHSLSRSILHEMMVVAVDSKDAPLPYDYNTGRIPEKQIKILGEAHDVQPNASKTLELTLPAGNYILVCNLPGHYAAGMSTPFTVTPE